MGKGAVLLLDKCNRSVFENTRSACVYIQVGIHIYIYTHASIHMDVYLFVYMFASFCYVILHAYMYIHMCV